MTAMTGIQSQDIIARLRASRYPQDQGWVAMEEVTPPRCQRRFDLIAINGWESGNREVHGVEIKVSRSDFLAEMKDPAKSKPLAALCNRYWLACPPGVAEANEVPASWGMLVVHDSQVRQAKAAPDLDPVPWSDATWRCMLWRCAQRTTTRRELSIAESAGYERRRREDEAAQIRRESEAKRRAEAEQSRIKIWEDATGVAITRWISDGQLMGIARIAQRLHELQRSKLADEIEQRGAHLAEIAADLAKQANVLREIREATP
jgi:hypothetical protein